MSNSHSMKEGRLHYITNNQSWIVDTEEKILVGKSKALEELSMIMEKIPDDVHDGCLSLSD